MSVDDVPVQYACPICHVTSAPAAQILAFAICGSCGASLVVAADGTVRAATGADTAALIAADLQELRRARGAIARKDRVR